jgi:mycobactin salicyl-AMP ligase
MFPRMRDGRVSSISENRRRTIAASVACFSSIPHGGAAIRQQVEPGLTAAVLATPSDAPPQDNPWGAMRLCGLLEAAARRHERRPAFRDQPGREAWCGRPRLEWSYALAVKIVARLAAAFSALRLEPGSPIGICLPGSSEAALTILAVEKAGHRPCLLPAAWREVELERALLAARVAAVVSFGRVAEDSPAEILCRIAARSFGLRFLLAYGPGVPDGVIDLDRVLVDDGAAPVEPGTAAAPDDPGLITFGRRGGQASPLHRTAAALVASAVNFLVAARISPGDRILSLLAADGHCGLATGLAAALLSGATLECHGLFDAAGLGQALADDVPTHLVAPGWLEPAIAAAGLSSRLASTVLVHAAPIRFRAKMPLKESVVDVIAFDELALMARARDAAGRLTLALGDDGGAGAFLRVRRDEDGAISFSGPAAEVRSYARAGMEDAGSGTGWRNSGFKADVFAGIVIGIS